MMLSLEEAKQVLTPLVQSGRLIIFVGSGISKDSGLPLWDGFIDNYIDFCKHLANQYRSYEIEKFFESDLLNNATDQKNSRPAHVATVLKARMSELPKNIKTNVENDFRRWFFKIFAAAEPNIKHKLIAGTNYPYILTSNYDLLLEEAAKNIGFPYYSLSFFQKDLIAEALYLRKPAIIHVHGQCTDVLLDKIILTSEDYIKIIKKSEPGFSFSVQSLFLTHSTLFVGYGASDPHLEDLIEEFAYFFDFPQTSNMSKNYLVVKRDKVGKIFDDYKRRMRTELIVIDDFTEYESLLSHLQTASPRQFDLPL